MGTKRSSQATRNEPHHNAHELAASLTTTLTLAGAPSSPPTTNRARAGSAPTNTARHIVNAVPRRAVQPRPAAANRQQDDGDGAVQPQPPPPRPGAARQHPAGTAARSAPARPATPPSSRRVSPLTLSSAAGSPSQQQSPPVPTSVAKRAPAPAPALASTSNSATRAPPTFTDGVTLCWPAEIPGQIDRDHDHEARVAARLGLRGFPPGYAVIKRTKPSGRSDRYIYGHPSRRTFRSVVEFRPHVEWLLLVSSDPAAEKRDPCTCLVCHPENKVKKLSSAKSGKPTAASAAALPSVVPASAPTTPKKRKREVVVGTEPSSSASSPASTASVPSVPLPSSMPPPPASSHSAATSRAAAARARVLSKLPIRSRAIPKSPRAPVLASDAVRDESTVRSPTRQQHSGSGAAWLPSFSQSVTPVPAPAAARQSRGFASLAGSSQGTGHDAGTQDTAKDAAHAAKKRRGGSYVGFGALAAAAHPHPPRSPSPDIDIVGVDSDDEGRLRDVLAVGGRRARPTGKSAVLEPPSPVAPLPPPPPAPARNALVQSPPGPVRDAVRARGEQPTTVNPHDLFVLPPPWPAQPGAGLPRPPGAHGFGARPPLAPHQPSPPRDPRLPPALTAAWNLAPPLAPAASWNPPPPPHHVAPRDPRLPLAAATNAPSSPTPWRTVPRDPRLALAASASSSPAPLPPRPVPRDSRLPASSRASISAPPSPAVPRDPRLAPVSSVSFSSGLLLPPPSRPTPRDPRLAATIRPGPYSISPSRIVSSSTARSSLSREQEERLRKSGNWGLKGGTAGRGTPPARPTPAAPGAANDPRQVRRAAWQRGAPLLVPYGLSYSELAGRALPIAPAPGTYTPSPPPIAPAPGIYTLPPPPVVPSYDIGLHASTPTPPLPATSRSRATVTAPPPPPPPAAPTKSRNSQFQQVRRIYLGGPAGLQVRRPVVVLPVPPPPLLLATSSRTRGPADQSVLQIPTSSNANAASYQPAVPQRPATAVRAKPNYPPTPISVMPEPTATRAPATAPTPAARPHVHDTAPAAALAVQVSRGKDAVPATAKPTKRKFEVIVISDSEDDDQIDGDMAVASEDPDREDKDVRADNVEAEGTEAEVEGASTTDAERVKITHAVPTAAKEPARNAAGAFAVNAERVEVARAAAPELVGNAPDARTISTDKFAVAQTTAEEQVSPRKLSAAARPSAPAPGQLQPPSPDVNLSSASEPATSPPPKQPAAAVPVWDDEASAESVPMTKAPAFVTRGVGSDNEDGDDSRAHHTRRKRRKVKQEESQPSLGTGQENMTAQVDALLEQVDQLSLQGKPFPRFSLMQVCWMTLTKDEAREIDEEIMRDRKAQNQPWNDIVRKDPDADLPSDCDSDVDAANPEPWRDPKTGAARRHRRSHMWPVMVLSIYRPGFDPHEDELFMDSERVNEVDAVDPATLEYTVVKLPLTWYWRHLFALTEGLEDDADPRHFTTSRFYRFLVETAWQDFKDTDQLGGALDRTAAPMLDLPYEHHPPLRPIHQAPFLHRVAASRLQHFRTLKERPSRAAPLWSSAVMQAIALDASWEVIEFDEEVEIGDFDEDHDVEVEEAAPGESRARRTRTASATSGAAAAPAPVRPPVTKEFYFLRLGSELITRGDDVWVVRNSRLPSGDYATPLEQLRRGPTPTELPPSVVRMCTRREVEGMQRIVSGNDAANDPIIIATRSTDRDMIARVKLTTHTVTRFPPTEQRRPYLAYGMDRHLRMIDVVSTSVETRHERWGSRRIAA